MFPFNYILIRRVLTKPDQFPKGHKVYHNIDLYLKTCDLIGLDRQQEPAIAGRSKTYHITRREQYESAMKAMVQCLRDINAAIDKLVA